MCWGTGESTREFLYAGDAAQAIVHAVNSNFDSNLPINLGTGKQISIKQLAVLIKKLTGYTGDIVFTGEVSNGQPERQLNVNRAKELLNWVAPTSLEVGLQKSIDWYRLRKS
jgi:GDP-L-fucose synthase